MFKDKPLIEADDWLEKERKRESLISVWDMDDKASVLKDEHSSHCERQENAMEHHLAHMRSMESKDIRKNKKNVMISAVIFFYIISILLMMCAWFY